MNSINTNIDQLTVATIKGTAMNRGKPRIWLEKQEKAMQGWKRGDAYTVTIISSMIVIKRDPKGDRAVAGRSRNGKNICILDLTCSEEQRQSILNGSDKFTVRITRDHITFKGA